MPVRLDARLAGDLFFFRVLVEAGGFARAGDRLAVTQSAVTPRIQRLERRLGYPLLERGTREIRLTAAGHHLFAAARSQDGRGPKTSLERAVPAHFELARPDELAEAIHRGRIPSRRLQELPPVVFAEAVDDEVAAEIVGRLAREIVAMARVALERLELRDEPAEVLLGGGLLQSGDGPAVEAELRRVAPRANVTMPSSPPIVGAALLGLDAIGASPEAQQRTREELEAAVAGEGADG